LVLVLQRLREVSGIPERMVNEGNVSEKNINEVTESNKIK
jgi:hypothetical protein